MNKWLLFGLILAISGIVVLGLLASGLRYLIAGVIALIVGAALGVLVLLRLLRY